jgi:hypothetical protein
MNNAKGETMLIRRLLLALFLGLIGLLAFSFTEPVGAQVWVNPAPMPTTPVTLPTVSPGAQAGVQQLHYGTGATYVDTWPDTLVTSASINSATTTQILAGVANQTMYVFMVVSQSGGTNSAITEQLEYGQGATCGTNTVKVTPFPILFGAPAVGVANYVWPISLVNVMVSLSYPLIVPANATAYNLCLVTAGTTILQQAIVYYAIHAN